MPSQGTFSPQPRMQEYPPRPPAQVRSRTGDQQAAAVPPPGSIAGAEQPQPAAGTSAHASFRFMGALWCAVAVGANGRRGWPAG
jgi:hypothetical protein